MNRSGFETFCLVKPDEAEDEVSQIYEEICRLKDPRWLGPFIRVFRSCTESLAGILGTAKTSRSAGWPHFTRVDQSHRHGLRGRFGLPSLREFPQNRPHPPHGTR